jgi:hypothetical protein
MLTASCPPPSHTPDFSDAAACWALDARAAALHFDRPPIRPPPLGRELGSPPKTPRSDSLAFPCKRVPGEELKAEMEGLQARKTALLAQMASMKQPEPLLHPGMADVYRTKVQQLDEALQTDDVEQREAARSGLRALITKIVIPPGDGLMRVFGNLGAILATAASGRDVSTLAGVAQSGCGGLQPAVLAAVVRGGVTRHRRRRSSRDYPDPPFASGAFAESRSRRPGREPSRCSSGVRRKANQLVVTKR